jgi:hypothetical protein
MNNILSRKESDELFKKIADSIPKLDPNSEVGKVIADPDYIYSAEFAMKHTNFKDNGDGTMSISRPVPYQVDKQCQCEDSSGNICGKEMSKEEIDRDGMCGNCAGMVWNEMA